MKFIKIISSLLLIVTFAQAQTDINKFKIYGHVSDILTKESLIKATLTLKEHTSKKIINSQSDLLGNFTFNKLPKGNYTLTANYVGHNAFSRPNILIDGNKEEVFVGELFLESNLLMLKDVMVTGSKLVIENRIDKLVYNAALDVTSQTGVATDILKKVPQVTVDASGNVELRGNSSIKFLINGKPSAIFGNSVADALQSIPAAQIQSIEVITSPGAKYEATGTGGIINIILKKSDVEGINGNINFTAGTRLENGALNFAWRHKNLSLSTYFGLTEQLKTSTQNLSNRISNQASSQNTLIQDGNSDLSRNSARAGLGFDWNVTKKDHFGLSFSYNDFGNNNSGLIQQQSYMVNPSGAISNQINSIRNATSNFSVQSFDWNLDFKRKFNNDKHELDFSYHLSRGKNESYYDQLQKYSVNNELFNGSKSNNPGQDNSSYVSLDYSLPLTKKLIIEAGGRVELNEIISNANVFSFNRGSKVFELDKYQSYQSDYHRKIYAAYLSTSFKVLKFVDVLVGTRIEQTTNKANYSNAQNVNIPGYRNIAPALTLSHSFANEQMIKFAYSYRIERPDYRDLNPFMNLSDPHNITTGNPQLAAELGNKFEMGYSKTFNKGNSINVAAFYDHNNPDIKPYTQYFATYMIGDTTYSDVNLTTRKNISSEFKSGINLSGSFLFFDKITVRPNALIYDRQTINYFAFPAKVNGIECRVNMNASCQINKSFIAEAFYSYNSGLRWQGHQPSFASYTMAIKKIWFNNKASLGLVAVNAFNRNLNQLADTYGENYTQTSIKKIPYRSFGVSLAYKFGKLKFNQPKQEDNFLLKPPIEN